MPVAQWRAAKTAVRTRSEGYMFNLHDWLGRSETLEDVVTAAPASAWEKKWIPDEVLLFRYSALTFNGHRIHYDRRYVTEVEGYPGPIVHGPLIATLLIELLREQMPAARIATFEFRAMRAMADMNHFFVCGAPQTDGKTVRLWARDHEGWLAMDATASMQTDAEPSI